MGKIELNWIWYKPGKRYLAILLEKIVPISCIIMPEERLAEAFHQYLILRIIVENLLEPHAICQSLSSASTRLRRGKNCWRNGEQFVEDDDLSLKDLFDKHLFPYETLV